MRKNQLLINKISDLKVTVGEIKTLDTEAHTPNASVELDCGRTLTNVTFFYHCSPDNVDDGSSVFNVGNRVLVAENKYIIGFEDLRPRACSVRCPDIVEANLGEDISDQLSYAADYRCRETGPGTWSAYNIATDVTNGLKVTHNDGVWDQAGTYPRSDSWSDHKLSFVLDAAAEFTPGWYYLDYSFIVMPPSSAVVTIAPFTVHAYEQVDGYIVCRINPLTDPVDPSECFVKGVGERRGTVVDSLECNRTLSGSYTQCLEIEAGDAGNSIHDRTLNVVLSANTTRMNAIHIEYTLVDLDLQISSLSLRKIRASEVEDPESVYTAPCTPHLTCLPFGNWSTITPPWP